VDVAGVGIGVVLVVAPVGIVVGHL
jgi:hypothetical protein